MEIQTIILCVLAGLLAGVINTIAGSGSIITLSLLTFLGLPANIANATNRVGLLFQSAASSWKFQQTGLLDVGSNWKTILSAVLGAVLGAFMATELNPEMFEKAVGVIFIGLFFVLVFKPEKRIKSSTFSKQLLPVWMFIIGTYAGFIQAGAGVFMIAIMSIVWDKKITEVNPIKVFVILLINVVALTWYFVQGLVNWEVGFLLAIGQFIGAFIGVKLNNSNKNIEPKLRLLLLGLVALSVFKFLGIIEL